MSTLIDSHNRTERELRDLVATGRLKMSRKHGEEFIDEESLVALVEGGAHAQKNVGA